MNRFDNETPDIYAPLTTIDRSYRSLSETASLKYAVVTGPSRGGTSLVAAILHQVGINMGENLAPNFEDSGFHNAFYPEFNETKFNAQVKRRGFGKWGFKLPKAALFLPSIASSLGIESSLFVFVFRNLLEVAIGEEQRGGSLLGSLYHSSIFYLRICEFAHKTPYANVVVCSYEQLAQNPVPFCKEICKRFDISCSPDIIERVNSVNTGQSGGYYRFVQD